MSDMGWSIAVAVVIWLSCFVGYAKLDAKVKTGYWLVLAGACAVIMFFMLLSMITAQV